MSATIKLTPDGGLRRSWPLAVFLLLAVVGAGCLLASQRAGSDAGAATPTGRIKPVTAGAKGIGFSVPTFPALSPGEQRVWLNDFRALGITWIRFDISWAAVQPANASSYDWSRYDTAVANANAYGIHVDAEVDYSTPWANIGGCSETPDHCQPASPRAYATYAAAIARHFGARVSAEEIWNEPNISKFWRPAPDPAFYVSMLKDAYIAIKSADRSMVVVSGGLAEVLNNGVDISPVTFTRDMYRDGAQGYFDALGDHPYSYPALPSQYESWSGWSEMSQTRPSIRSIMAAYGDSATPVWITEVGSPTGGPGAGASCGSGGGHAANKGQHVSQCLQAEEITQVVADERSLGWLGPAFIYSFQDLGVTQGNEHDFFGLLTAYGGKKLSYMALKEAIGDELGSDGQHARQRG
jgi:polysaccharide biosynthesis protein PslG